MSNVIDIAVAYALDKANDNSHGYSQDANRRMNNPDFDCSSLVILSYRAAGLDLKSTFTGNMYEDFLAHGFSDVTKSVNLGSGSGCQKGDVLLNKTKHTAIALGDGLIVHASSSENGGKYGQPGDQTGNEICVRSYYNKPWDCVLRYTADDVAPVESKGDNKVMVEVRQLQYGMKGNDVKSLQTLLNLKANSRHLVVDGDFGNNTKSVTMDFQRTHRDFNGNPLAVDGIVGKNTWYALLNN